MSEDKPQDEKLRPCPVAEDHMSRCYSCDPFYKRSAIDMMAVGNYALAIDELEKKLAAYDCLRSELEAQRKLVGELVESIVRLNTQMHKINKRCVYRNEEVCPNHSAMFEADNLIAKAKADRNAGLYGPNR